MSKFSEEAKILSNPILGAYLIWKITKGYSEHNSEGSSPNIFHLYLAMGVLLSPELSLEVNNYKKNIQSFVRSFDSKNNPDALYSIQDIIFLKKEYILDCITSAMAQGLIIWEPEDGNIYHNTLKSTKGVSSVSKIYKDDGKKADILGKWFANLSIEEITSYLKVVL